jgi:hypothetical protein
MNYYAARQRQKDKKWDYTSRNDDFTQPVGYCAAYVEWTEEMLKRLGLYGKPENHPSLMRQQKFKDKYHICGHDTKEEAENCYREYLLDQHLKLNREHPDAQIKCAVCGKWTTLYAEIDMHMWDLCEEHNNREEVEKLFEAPGEIWSS